MCVAPTQCGEGRGVEAGVCSSSTTRGGGHFPVTLPVTGLFMETLNSLSLL